MEQNDYPQMSYEDTVQHCKHWAEEIRIATVETLVQDYGAAIGISDQLAYPLDMQTWITKEGYPALYNIRDYAVRVDSNHRDRAAWEKLLQLIDKLLAT